MRWSYDSGQQYLSYAEDVLNEITKPRTVPSTVKSWLLIPRWCSVFSETKQTTRQKLSARSKHDRRAIRIGDRLTGCNQREESDLRPYVIDNCSVKLLQGPCPSEKRTRRNHSSLYCRKEREKFSECGVLAIQHGGNVGYRSTEAMRCVFAQEMSWRSICCDTWQVTFGGGGR